METDLGRNHMVAGREEAETEHLRNLDFTSLDQLKVHIGLLVGFGA
jgi:hypothetical protein